ncbi:site-specific integrase [Nitrosopumilus adriaticus]|uniref:Site-specific recombinase, phage integrase family n=1 Tax=Nitrosopumilus adriaticus TaxID=1580092 RepID=A0A0D5C5S9_9ARCH|nr:site-specific integrase [Nitrosopumilus adriaticus]AJW71742.1 Site-specific recombinase, phage integrase family [Nitrosopumilus adriaticus]
MEISFDEVNSRSDPYQLFLDSIRSPSTLRRYKNLLQTFLKLVPNKFYTESLGKTPQDREPATLAKFFVELARKDMKLASNIIATFIKADRKRVESGEISSQTIPNHIKPIKVLLDANSVPIHWKSLNKLLPRREAKSKDRAYTKEEIQKMFEVSSNITDRVLILMFSSGGFRLEAWDYFTWKDIIFFKNDDGSYKGAALLIYRGDPESYFTFITPEACKALEVYRENWKADIGVYPKPDDPLIKTVASPMIRRLAQKGVRKRIDKVVTDIGLRPPLPLGVRRHEVQLDHGFRKYFNTMLRRAKVDYLDKEDMMGHKVGLEKHYERYQEEDFERFPEYQKAIPFLTISDEEKIRFENEKLLGEKSDLEKKNEELMKMQLDMDKIKQRLDISENFEKV